MARNGSSIVPLSILACEVSVQAVSAELYRQDLVAREAVPLAEIQTLKTFYSQEKFLPDERRGEAVGNIDRGMWPWPIEKMR